MAEKELLVGGQAVLEGVMMKLPRAWAVAVRRANGELACRSGPHVPWTERWPILKLPVLRGVATLFSMLGLGMRALFFSSDVAARDQEGAGGSGTAGKAPGVTTLAAATLLVALTSLPDGTEVEEEEAVPGPAAGSTATHESTPLPDGGGLSKTELGVSIAMAAVMFLLLFKALPLGLAWGAAKLWPALAAPLAESVISGVALAAIFVTYLLLLSLVPDIRRVFQYHGAEHKVVWLHEKRGERTVAAAALNSTLHPRCGTSFLFFVVLTSIVVWSLFPVDWGFLGKLGLRLALFPLIVGLSYELIRLTARRRESLFFRGLMAPGLWSQRITTRLPDDGMLEVSLHSLALAERAHAPQEAAASGPR